MIIATDLSPLKEIQIDTSQIDIHRIGEYQVKVFVEDIYKNRKTVLDYLNSVNIESIGRFGKWDYMWTHQAFADGMKTALKQS